SKETAAHCLINLGMLTRLSASRTTLSASVKVLTLECLASSELLKLNCENSYVSTQDSREV
ncbi:hypothetical protein PJF56_03780, partial [Roseofilum sp. BLCC_M91]